MTANRLLAYRRTVRAAVLVASVLLISGLATTPGSAAPAAEDFNRGTGSATALGYKVNPKNGNLSFGVTFGESIAGHQNTGATGQSRAVNLGVIGVTLAGEACDGGDATWAEEEQPQPVIARSGEKGAAEGTTEFEQGAPGGIKKFARATTDPFAEAITTIAPMGDPRAVEITGGRTITHSGVVDGSVREALARTELGTVSLGGGAIVLRGLTWEAIHRSGSVEETVGSFSIGSVEIAGQPQTLPGDSLEQAEALDALLHRFGLDVTPPGVRIAQGIVFVDPLKIGVIPSAERDTVLGGVVGGAQPLRDQIVDALLDQDCSNATYVTIADIVLGSFTGAGSMQLELGGVQATTAEIQQFSFPDFGSLPPLLGTPAVPGSFTPGSPGSSAVVPGAASAGDASPDQGDTTTRVATQPIAGFAGERGGLMALVAGSGLALVAATAEADRRKMQRALREIPLES